MPVMHMAGGPDVADGLYFQDPGINLLVTNAVTPCQNTLALWNCFCLCGSGLAPQHSLAKKLKAYPDSTERQYNSLPVAIQFNNHLTGLPFEELGTHTITNILTNTRAEVKLQQMEM